jgi:hypothetical protein
MECKCVEKLAVEWSRTHDRAGTMTSKFHFYNFYYVISNELEFCPGDAVDQPMVGFARLEDIEKSPPGVDFLEGRVHEEGLCIKASRHGRGSRA